MNAAKDTYVFARGYQSGFGFVIVNEATLTAVTTGDPLKINGNFVNLATYRDFVAYLATLGFTAVKTLPATIVSAVEKLHGFHTFFAIPAGLIGDGGYFEDTFLTPYEEVQQ